jgi:hypothetical protein
LTHFHEFDWRFKTKSWKSDFNESYVAESFIHAEIKSSQISLAGLCTWSNGAEFNCVRTSARKHAIDVSRFSVTNLNASFKCRVVAV